MLKPFGYDDAKVNSFGEKITLPAGAYVCRIKSVEENETATGTPQIRVCLDIAEGDYYHYWNNKWQEKLAENPRAGFPRGGVSYIAINKWQSDEVNPQFKAFCEAFKKTNDCEINWTAGDWGKQFEQKFIGAVYRLEEQEYNGHRYMQPLVRYWCSVDSARNGDIKPPAPKYLNSNNDSAPSEQEIADAFAKFESDIPF
jgi:hypothetical protein